jgi:FkbM family methyltransferase
MPVLRRQLNLRPGAFVDVGVNVGQTLLKILGLDRHRAYFGFEPQIACCFDVEQFLRLNGLSNATVLPIALSDSNEVMTFYAHGQYDEMGSLIPKQETGEVGGAMPLAMPVQARIGDEVLRELGIEDICAIKIDVEGAELSVLRGLQETLRTRRPAVIFEVLPNFYGLAERKMQPAAECTRNQASADAIFRMLNGAAYEIFQIDEAGGETRISRFELDDPSAFVGSNYIAHAR